MAKNTENAASRSLVRVSTVVAIVALSCCFFSSGSVVCRAQDRLDSKSSIREIALHVAGSGGSFQQTQRLVDWMTRNFAWTATDYQKRTPEQIVARRGGNCAELASVLEILLKELDIRYRWIAEINVQPDDPGRQERAAAQMARLGNQASIFGLRHNDHRWLEVYDDRKMEWFPADPATGVVGIDYWIPARMGFGTRPASPIPAIRSVMRDMFVPFVVVTLNSRSGAPEEDRTQYYLVDQFNNYYQHHLRELPAWTEWTHLIWDLSTQSRLAFTGRADLHLKEDEIARLYEVYERLQQQAHEKGID